MPRNNDQEREYYTREVKWVRGWEDILRECPRQPRVQGVWKLAECGTKWIDISHNIAEIPDLIKPKHYPDRTCKMGIKKRTNHSETKKWREHGCVPQATKKPTRADAATQTDFL